MEPANQLGLKVSSGTERFGVVGLELRTFLYDDNIDTVQVTGKIIIFPRICQLIQNQQGPVIFSIPSGSLKQAVKKCRMSTHFLCHRCKRCSSERPGDVCEDAQQCSWDSNPGLLILHPWAGPQSCPSHRGATQVDACGGMVVPVIGCWHSSQGRDGSVYLPTQSTS